MGHTHETVVALHREWNVSDVALTQKGDCTDGYP